MGRLQAVPDAQPRALGLVRVSKERGEMIAPDIQRAAIEDHCARRGYRLVDVVEALDESGSQRRSPWWARLDKAVAAVESGEYDVIAVWKFSRAARHRLRWAVAIDRVETAGGRLESATEAVDVSTSTGRFTRGMLGELAAFEAERIGDVWREVHARRTGRGLPANGKPRFGYAVVDGMHRPDPDTGPVLSALYRRYVAGESFYSLACWLNAQGVLTVPGYSSKGPGPWSSVGLRRMLDAGFGAGFITVHGGRQAGAHEPVVDTRTWQQYLAARERRRTLRRAERSPYLLSSMVWCGCGSRMGYSGWGRTKHSGLRCLVNSAPGGPRHPNSCVRASLPEGAVLQWLTAQAKDLDVATDAALAHRARLARRRADAKQLAREVVELDKAIGKLTADHARGLIPDVALGPGMAELTAQREQLERAHTVALAEAQQDAPRRVASRLLADWDLLPVEQRRAGLRSLIARVVVTGWTDPPTVEVVPI